MTYLKPRRNNRFRRNDRNFGRENFRGPKTNDRNGSLNNFQRKSISRNGQNPEKLLETYNNLAKEASSNGDEVLSETYYQYADHFLRVIESRNSNHVQSKPHSNNSQNKINLEDEKKDSVKQTQTQTQDQKGEEI